MSLGFNRNRAPSTGASRTRVAIGSVLLGILPAACGSDEGKVFANPSVLEQAAANPGFYELPAKTECPKGGHKFGKFDNKDTFAILMGPVRAEDPDSPTYAVLIESAYDATGTICGRDAGPEFGLDSVRFNGKAVATLAGSTALMGISLK